MSESEEALLKEIRQIMNRHKYQNRQMADEIIQACKQQFDSDVHADRGLAREYEEWMMFYHSDKGDYNDFKKMKGFA